MQWVGRNRTRTRTLPLCSLGSLVGSRGPQERKPERTMHMQRPTDGRKAAHSKERELSRGKWPQRFAAVWAATGGGGGLFAHQMSPQHPREGDGGKAWRRAAFSRNRHTGGVTPPCASSDIGSGVWSTGNRTKGIRRQPYKGADTSAQAPPPQPNYFTESDTLSHPRDVVDVPLPAPVRDPQAKADLHSHTAAQGSAVRHPCRTGGTSRVAHVREKMSRHQRPAVQT